jgi:predicted GNAT superfamily acetyltransferase
MAGSVPLAPDSITCRPLSSLADYEACIALQRATWGETFSDVVPFSILKINQKAGGISAGAFAPDGRLLGFVFGLTGVRGGASPGNSPGSSPKLVHWSHMLAIAPEARDLGLGTRLKLYQRDQLLPLGVERVEWSYDPLEARNAHLNLNHLGAVPAEYVRDMYEGEMGESDLARGIGTDRFVLAWEIAGERVARRLAEGPPDPAATARRFAGSPIVGPEVGSDTGELPEAPLVRVEIPADVQSLKSADPERARAFRASTRRAFESYLGRGWRVEDFYREPGDREEKGRCFYGVTAPEGRP